MSAKLLNTRLVLASFLLAVLVSSCTGPLGGGNVQTLSGHTLWVESVAWSPDGKSLASASADGSVIISDAATGHTVTTLSYGGTVSSVAWSPDGKYLAAGFSAANSVRVTETGSWKTISEWNAGAHKLVSSVAWSPDSSKLAVCATPSPPDQDSSLDIWDASSHKTIAQLIQPPGVDSASWSPNGEQVAFVSSTMPGTPDGTILIWNLSKGGGRSTDENTALFATDATLVEHIDWSPDGKHLVSSTFDHLVKVWDVAGKQRTDTLTGHTEIVESVAWSPDGKQIASGSWDRTARIWDVASGKEVARFDHPDYVNSVAWSPDGKYLATGDNENFNNVRIWKVK